MLEAANISDGTNKFLMTCVVHRLGLVEYDEAYELQKRLHSDRLKGIISDTLLLLEHPPTLTIGRSGTMKNVLVSKDELTDKGITLFSTDRGGDVTFHGPGQLVGYPIIDLSRRGKDIHRYVHDLEEVIIQTLKDFSITAERDEGHAGVWVQNEEIAAIGLSVRSWVTMHGFALNVNPNLEYFSLINPCGFSDREATSMSTILGDEVSMEEVANRLIANLSRIFSAHMEIGAAGALKGWK
jgi:lipoate-protein ligase B